MHVIAPPCFFHLDRDASWPKKIRMAIGKPPEVFWLCEDCKTQFGKLNDTEFMYQIFPPSTIEYQGF